MAWYIYHVAPACTRGKNAGQERGAIRETTGTIE